MPNACILGEVWGVADNSTYSLSSSTISCLVIGVPRLLQTAFSSSTEILPDLTNMWFFYGWLQNYVGTTLYAYLSWSYLRKALVTLIAVGSRGLWNSAVFFSTNNFLRELMAGWDLVLHGGVSRRERERERESWAFLLTEPVLDLRMLWNNVRVPFLCCRRNTSWRYSIVFHLYRDEVVSRSERWAIVISCSKHVRFAPVHTSGTRWASGAIWAGGLANTTRTPVGEATASLTHQAAVKFVCTLHDEPLNMQNYPCRCIMHVGWLVCTCKIRLMQVWFKALTDLVL